MAKEIVKSLRNTGTAADPVWEQYFVKTIAAAVLMSSDDGETKDIKQYVDEAINKIVGGAVPETLDTLKEIAEYIESHKEVVDAINAAIAKKVDKVSGKQLSTEDFTTALKTKLDGIKTGANKTTKSTTNGNVLIDGEETIVYTHPETAGNKHIPAGGTTGQILVNNGAGSVMWKDKETFNVPEGSTTTKGVVQLSSATNSESEELAATPKAVKQAYDKAVGANTAAGNAAQAASGASSAAGAAQKTANEAKEAAAKAQKVADGKTTVYFASELPSSAPVGSVCFLITA